MAGTCEPEVQICFAKGLYDLEAMKRAAYHLSDRLVVEIDPKADDVTCTLRLRKPEFELVTLADQFRTMVLDYDLRIRIGKETEPMRNLVLSLAFSKTGLPG